MVDLLQFNDSCIAVALQVCTYDFFLSVTAAMTTTISTSMATAVSATSMAALKDKIQ